MKISESVRIAVNRIFTDYIDYSDSRLGTIHSEEVKYASEFVHNVNREISKNGKKATQENS